MAVSEEMVVRLTADIARFEASMNRATNTNARTARAIERRWQQTNSHVARSFQTLGRVAAGAFAALGGALAIREAVRAGDAWTRFGNQLNAVAVQLERPVASLDALVEVAMRSRSSLESTVTLYSRLERAGQTLGMTQEEVLRVTETLNQAFIVSGASTSEQLSTIRQLTQGISSGILGGEELRAVRENLPILAQAIADTMGVSIGELRDLGAQGRITGEVVFNAMRRMTEGANGVDAQFAEMGLTVEQAMTNLRTAALQAVGGMDEATGSTSTFATAINDLAELIRDNRDELNEFAAAIAGIIGVTVRGAAEMVRFARSVREFYNTTDQESSDRLQGLAGRIFAGDENLRSRPAIRTALRQAYGDREQADRTFSMIEDLPRNPHSEFFTDESLAQIASVLNDLGRARQTIVDLREEAADDIDVNVNVNMNRNGDTGTDRTLAGAAAEIGETVSAELDKAKRDAIADFEELTASLEALFTELDEAREQMGEEKQRLGDEMIAAFHDRHEQMREGFRQAFSSGVMAGIIDGEEGLTNWFRNAAYRGLENALNRLADQLFDLFAQAGSGGGKGGGGFFSSIISSLFGGGKAGGGPVAAGMTYRVGEQGPETFVPKMPGVIVPHHVGAVSGGGGNTTVVQQFHLHAEGAVMTDQLLRNMERRAQVIAGQAVITQGPSVVEATLPAAFNRARRDMRL